MLESRFLLGTLFTTFLLIMLGGFVHNTESSLACPDWPWCDDLCKGKPVPEEQKAVRIEHRHQIEIAHRILASIVGFFTVTFFVLLLLRKRFKASMTLFALGAVFLVLFQGLLGALTVKLQLPTYVSTAHLGVAQLFFALLLLLFYFIQYSSASQKTARPEWKHLKKLVGITALLIYSQILLGAYMRHSGSGLSAGAGPKGAILAVDYQTGETTFWPSSQNAQWNMLHRYMGLVVAFFAVLSGIKLLALGTEIPIFKKYGYLLIFSVLIQILLGVLSIWYFLHIVLVTLHLGVGTFCFAVILATYFHLQFLISPWNYHKTLDPKN